MIRLRRLAALALAAAGVTFASGPLQGGQETAGPAFDGRRAFADLERIVDIGPRPAGSAALRQTRAYITRQLAASGLVVQEQPFTAETPLGRVEMANLIVRLPGRRPDRLLIAGHYDTKLFRGARFVGANDGGSSTAFLLEIARVLSAQPREFTIEIVWFDGEEAFVEWTGLDHTYGSRYYVQAATDAGALPSIGAMILVDMIGDRDLVLRRDLNSTPWLTDLLWHTAAGLGHQRVFVAADTAVEDDHRPFIDAGVPAVDLIDLDYPPWHTPGDTIDQVSAQSLQIVGDVLLAAIPAIEDHLRGEDAGPGQRQKTEGTRQKSGTN